MKTDFEKLNELWTAIRDVDEIFKSDTDDKIDDIINAVKNINKKEFDMESQDIIVSGFRQGLLNIYRELFDNLNNGIDELGGLAHSKINKARPVDSNNTSVNRVEDVNNGSTQEYFVSSQSSNDIEEEPEYTKTVTIDESRVPDFLRGRSKNTN